MANLPRMEIVHGDRTVQWIRYGCLEGGQMSDVAHLELHGNFTSAKHFKFDHFTEMKIAASQLQPDINASAHTRDFFPMYWA